MESPCFCEYRSESLDLRVLTQECIATSIVELPFARPSKYVLEHILSACSHNCESQQRIFEVCMKSMSRQITRRQALAGTAAGIAITVSRFSALAQQPATPAQQPDTSQKTAASPNQARTSLHQEIELNAAPERIFHILLDSKEFAGVTGMAATIDPSPGGAFNTFGGLIEGRNIEIITDRRIVQAWRPTYWTPGVYTIVHFELKASSAPNTSSVGTTLVLDHTGFPEGEFDHLDPGWHMRYWDPMKKYLAAHP
jgi:activator of HSP90 ATPase